MSHIAAYALSITWDGANLPRDVGPFPTRREAEEWARQNIPNGTWNVVPLRAPYRLRGETE